MSGGLLAARGRYERYLSARPVGADAVQIRALFERLVDELPAPTTAVPVTEQVIGGVPCVVAGDNAGRPPLMWLHAGGYVFGSARAYNGLAAALADRTGSRVVVPDHRLAPEHPYPAALDDALAVGRAISGTSGMLVAGDSSGGGLACVVGAELAQDRPASVRGIVMVTPWVDLAVKGDWSAAGDFDPQVDQDHLRRMARAYLGPEDACSPRVSPLYADLSGSPPLLVLAAGRDKLMDDALRFARVAAEAGADVTLRAVPEVMHLWPLFHEIAEESAAALDDIAAFTTRVGPR